MINLIQYLFENFGIPIVIVGVIIIFVTYFMRKYFESRISTIFEKQLSTYQSELDISLENSRFEFQRKIQNFSIYTEQKHTKYVELYGLLLEAESLVFSLWGFNVSLSLEEFNSNDIQKLMMKRHFPEGKQSEILKLWKNSGKDTAIASFRKYSRMIEFQEAEHALNQVKEYYWKSIIYFSEELEKILGEHLDELIELQITYKMLDEIPSEDKEDLKHFHDTGAKLKKSLKNRVPKIISLLREEMSVGYFEKNAT